VLKVTSHSYWENGTKVKSTLGNVRVNLHGKKRNLNGKGGQFLHVYFWEAREELISRKRNDHDLLDVSHY